MTWEQSAGFFITKGPSGHSWCCQATLPRQGLSHSWLWSPWDMAYQSWDMWVYNTHPIWKTSCEKRIWNMSLFLILVTCWKNCVTEHMLMLIPLLSAFFFLKIFYLFVREQTQEGGGAEGEGKAGSPPSREPPAGLDSRTAGLWDYDPRQGRMF